MRRKVQELLQKREASGVDMGYRSLEVRASSLNEESRTIDATISTETPVPMPDWERMAMVPEVLLSSGAEYPKSRQVPFLDSHNRSSVKDQLGSARGITVESGRLSATLNFSSASGGDDAFKSVREGHVTDVSVGYEVQKRVFVKDGDSKTISGRTFTGPVNVVTKWKLREVSLTPIGADAQAKLRGLDPAAFTFRSLGENEKEEFKMNEELRKLLESKGMPATLTDEQRQQWQIDNIAKWTAPEKPVEKREERHENKLPTSDELAELVAAATERALKAAEEKRAAFITEVDSLCELADVPNEAAHCRSLKDIAAVREHIKATKVKESENIPYSGSVRVLSTGADRLKVDLRSALMLKACRSAVNGNEAKLDRYYPKEERSKAADNFRHATLFDMATEFVRAQGVQTLGLTRDQIAISAMFGPEKAGIRGASYHSTGSFANLTLDAVNKSMMIGYSEVPATWRGPMKQGQSATDFKTIHRMQLGAIPNLPVWDDSQRPNLASMADGKESYAVEARSIGVDFGYKLIVNDDMSALTNTPMKLGDSAARTVNSVAWAQVTSNPTMRDAVALFSGVTGLRFRKNLTTGAGAPSTTTLGALTALMRLMRGENTPEGAESSDILNLSPSYLVVPASLETTAKVLVNSVFDPASTGAATYNPANTLTVVVEPLLEADSATAWYLFAEPTRVETVEVTFLAGQETPQVRSVMDEHTLAATYYVLQSVAAKALDHRGIQKHAGA